MSELNQDRQSVLDRFFNRENIITKEMRTLAKKGYIDTFTAEKVIQGYQKFTQDQLSEIHKAEAQVTATTPPSPVPKATKTIEQLASLKKADNHPRIQTEEIPILQGAEKKTKSAEQLRERHLNIILIAGVALLFLAGAVLATTSWLLLSPLVKVSLISLIAVVFLGMAKLATALKIPQTSQAFLILSCLFFPFPFLSGGYYQLFGSYLSLVGTGRFLFGFLLTGAFAVIYGVIGHKKQLRLMTQLSIGLGYISFLFLIRQMIPFQDIRGITTLALLLIFNERSSAVHQGFYQRLDTKQWQNSLGLINGITVVATVTTFRWTIIGTLLIGLLAVLSLQIGYHGQPNRLKWWRLSDCLIAVMFIIGCLVGLFTLMAGLVGSAFLIGYTLLRKYWQRDTERSTLFNKLQVRYHRKLIGLFILGVGSHLLFNESLNIGLINLLASTLALVANGLSQQTPTIKTKINLGFLTLILLTELLALSSLDVVWLLRILLIVALGLYNGLLRKEGLAGSLAYLTKMLVSSCAFLGIISWIILPDISMGELSCWSLLLLGSLYHVCLVSPTANRRLSPFVPLGLVLSLIPVCSDVADMDWSAFLLSLAVLVVGYLFRKSLAPAFMTASHGLSLLLYGISLIFLLATSFLGDAILPQLIILLFGSYLMYSCGIWLKQTLFFNGVPLMIFWSLMFLLSQLALANFPQLLYFEVLLVASYALVNYHKQKPLYFLGTVGLTIVLVLVWLLSIGQVAVMSDITPSFIGLFLPMAILGRYYFQVNNKWLKRGSLFVESYLVIALLQLSLHQLVAKSLDYHWQFFILTTLLTLGLFLKQQRSIIWPNGLLNVGFTLLLFLSASYGQLTNDWSIIVGSTVLLAYMGVYLVLSRLSQVPQLSILVTLSYYLCLLPSMIQLSSWQFSGIVWGLTLSSACLTIWQKHSLMLAKNRLNLMVIVQIIGIGGLLFLEINPLWIKLYLLLLSVTLSYIETNPRMKRGLLSLASISGFLLVDDGVRTYLSPNNPLLAQLLIYLAVLVTLTATLRFIWQKHQLAKIVEWVVSGMILVGYLIVSLGGSLTNGLYGAVFALLLVVISYLTKYTAYFTNGIIYLVSFILYSQRHFWAAIPWWLYLAIGGILLITLGSLSEWHRRNQSAGLVTVRNKIKKYFDDWQ